MVDSQPAVDCFDCNRGYKIDMFTCCPHCGSTAGFGLLKKKVEQPKVKKKSRQKKTIAL